MRSFDPENYESVKERKARFYKDNPDGRIVVEQINLPEQILECAEFKAYAYRNGSDQEKNLPWATGHALEIREKELSVSKDGKKYESVNYTSWTENAEESAVGRALDNAGYAGSPLKEEMKKVVRHTQLLNKTKTFAEEPQDHLEFPTENKFKDINKIQDYCTICAKGVSLATKKYCIEKNMPIMCYDCQKGKTIASKKKMAS